MIKEEYIFNITMVLVFFIPTTVFYLFNTPSQAIGVVISIILLFPLIIKRIKFLKDLKSKLGEDTKMI